MFHLSLCLVISALLAFLVLFLSYVPRWRLSFKYKHLPPGPKCWPLVGYLPFLDHMNGHLKLKELAKRFGPVFGIHVGNCYVVVLDEIEAVKSAYMKDEFSGRPPGIFPMGQGQTSIADASGTEWKEQRRFMVKCFHVIGASTTRLESLILELLTEVSASLRKLSGQDININDQIHLAVNNIAFLLIYGKRFDLDHPMIKLQTDFNQALATHFGVSGTKLFFPWIGSVMDHLPKVKKARGVMGQMDDIIRREISEHLVNLKVGEPRDFIDHYLLQMDKPGAESIFNMSSLLGNAKAMLLATSESFRANVVWFFLNMAAHPDIQDKVHQEIDSVLGREREPTYSDRVLLPFTDAAIMESLRLRPSTHISFLKTTLEDTTLCGYDIPKDTIIVNNKTSLCRNPVYYSRPNEYDPTRFLSRDGTKTQYPEHFIPFSYGKRNCFGEKLGVSNQFLFNVYILQHFRIVPPEGGVSMDMTKHFSICPVYPFARFEVRE